MATHLAERLAAAPWLSPSGLKVAYARLHAPARFCPQSMRVIDQHIDHHAGIRPFRRLRDVLGREYRQRAGHIFVGAAGIAARALAPLLGHKSSDPPVVVMSPDGRFAVSLVSGHWGGGNDLTRHIARLAGACPVITTASDSLASDSFNNKAAALDIFLRDAGLRVLDWDVLPKALAALLEGSVLRLWDPCRALPEPLPPGLERQPCEEEEHAPEFPEEHPPSVYFRGPPRRDAPDIAAHWRRLPECAGLLRCAVPRLFVGIGCRKNVPADAVFDAIKTCFAANNLETRAIAALATVAEKRREPALAHAAGCLGLPVLDFPADSLAAYASPNPSRVAARRFGQPPFSVCEASALMAAGEGGRLVLPKVKINGCLTVAVALGLRTWRRQA
ncbi:MAG: cobalamin biosynthesis protein [Desulfovibrio sp.]|jgi:cobalamin biosynthesis protein CbiG|nr:cobalamin biosynthesis protein [Desulfovibrio sp.]